MRRIIGGRLWRGGRGRVEKGSGCCMNGMGLGIRREVRGER